MTTATAISPAAQRLKELLTDVLFILEQVGIKPTPTQLEIMGQLCRFMLVTGGEQGGKSFLAFLIWVMHWNEDLVKFGADEILLYWLVAVDYKNTEREFRYIKDFLLNLLGGNADIRGGDKVDPGHIEVWYKDAKRPSLRIETKSAKDAAGSLTREAPHGIINCEASLLEPGTYDRTDGRVGPKLGWIFSAGTIEKGYPWFPQLARAWSSGYGDKRSFKLPSWSNPYVYPGGYEDPEIQRLKDEKSDEYFLERIAGEEVPVGGLVFPEFRIDMHMRDVQYIPGQRVYLWEDPGFGSHVHALLAAHMVDGQFQVFWEYYDNRFITEVIIDHVSATQPWWKEMDERRGGAGIRLTSDPHYKDQHHSMSSVAETWLKKTGMVASGTRTPINDGSERLKASLKLNAVTGIPGIVISPNCPGLLSELGAVGHPLPGQYFGQNRPYVWKLDREGAIIGETPDDKNNDAVKAVIYGLTDYYGVVSGSNRTIKVRHRRNGRLIS